MAISSCAETVEVVAIGAEGGSGVAVGLVNTTESIVGVKQYYLTIEERQPWSPAWTGDVKKGAYRVCGSRSPIVFHRLGVLVYIRPHGFDLDYVNFTSGETGYHTGPTPVN